jgi:hypothetical protein
MLALSNVTEHKQNITRGVELLHEFEVATTELARPCSNARFLWSRGAACVTGHLHQRTYRSEHRVHPRQVTIRLQLR